MKSRTLNNYHTGASASGSLEDLNALANSEVTTESLELQGNSTELISVFNPATVEEETGELGVQCALCSAERFARNAAAARAAAAAASLALAVAALGTCGATAGLTCAAAVAAWALASAAATDASTQAALAQPNLSSCISRNC